MIPTYQSLVRQAEAVDRNALANLIHFETHVHRHLDWRSPLDWQGHEPFLVAETHNRLQAALICPPDPPQVAWIRLFAFSSAFDAQEAWRTLWPTAHAQLAARRLQFVAAIPLQDWFRALLAKNQFTHLQDVVLLSFDSQEASPPPPRSLLLPRPMLPSDLPAVAALDCAAFTPLWQNSQESLALALEQAALATVIEANGEIIAYQMSTGGALGAHLARLAVHPQRQCAGVGYAMVYHLLQEFAHRGVRTITVNTQFENHASLSLYRKAGFLLTGEKYPVYAYSFSPT